MADVLTNSTVINLDVSIWTGKARLRRGEVDDSDMPPEEVATLGSKKLFDQNKLRSFRGIKSAAFAACNRYGVKFLSGWLVDNQYLPELTKKLAVYKDRWDEDLRAFCLSYKSDVEEWLEKNEEWRNMLSSSIPRQSEIAKRFNFGWQTFRVTPAPTNANGDQTEEEMGELPTRAMEKMAKELAEAAPVTKNDVLKTSTLRRLAALCEALSFAAPEMDKLAEVLNALANAKRSDALDKIVLTALSDARAIAKLCSPKDTADDIIEGILEEDARKREPEPVKDELKPQALIDVDGLIQGALGVLNNEPQEAVETPVEEEEKPTTQGAVDDALGTIDSEGLW